MKLTGHETDAVYSRYHIARGKDLRAGVARVADYIEALHESVEESGKETATAIQGSESEFAQVIEKWRRAGDSNPDTGYPVVDFKFESPFTSPCRNRSLSLLIMP